MKAFALRVASFGLIGALLSGLNYLVYSGLMHVGVHYALAATAGWAVGLVLSFVLNKRFTFSLRTAPNPYEIATFLGTYLLQFGLGLASLVALVSGLGVAPRPAFAINLVVTAAISFGLMRWVVFRPSPATPAREPTAV